MASASIGNPQSLNLFAYAGNNPVDFVDPSGLAWATVTQCNWYGWFVVGGGEPKYIDGSEHLVCRSSMVWIPDPADDGGGGNSNSAEPDEEIDQNCINALKDLGVWDKVQELLKKPPIIDIDGFLGLPRLGLGKKLSSVNDFLSIAGDLASDWVGGYSDFEGQTLGDWFDSGFSDARTVRGSAKIDAVYYRSSIYNLPNDTYLLLHELTHLAFPPEISREGLDLDLALIAQLDLTKRGNESPSDTVSRFFNSRCDPNQRFANDNDEYN